MIHTYFRMTHILLFRWWNIRWLICNRSFSPHLEIKSLITLLPNFFSFLIATSTKATFLYHKSYIDPAEDGSYSNNFFQREASMIQVGYTVSWEWNFSKFLLHMINRKYFYSFKTHCIVKHFNPPNQPNYHMF